MRPKFKKNNSKVISSRREKNAGRIIHHGCLHTNGIIVIITQPLRTPKDGTKGRLKRKAKKEKKGASSKPCSNNDEISTLKATVAAQNKLLALKEAQVRAYEMEAASKIIFEYDEDMGVETAALKRYLVSLEAQSVNFGAMAAEGVQRLS